MDPYLEHPDPWPDVHNSLIAAMRDALAPQVRPRYRVVLEERTYVAEPPELVLVGRPDLAVVGARPVPEAGAVASSRARPRLVEVQVPVPDRVRETYLEVRTVPSGAVVSVVEVLSPSNKRPGRGRSLYLAKRDAVLGSATSLVEVDLLRTGDRMPLVGAAPASDYAVLVSRAWARPRADLAAWGVADPIPAFPVPLRQGEPEPSVDLGALLSALYDRAGYDLAIDYGKPPQPPLPPGDAAWAARLVAAR